MGRREEGGGGGGECGGGGVCGWVPAIDGDESGTKADPTNATEKQTATTIVPAAATRPVHNAQNTNHIFSPNSCQNPHSAFKSLTAAAVAAVAAALTAYASRL